MRGQPFFQAFACLLLDPGVQSLVVGHRVLRQEVFAQAHLDVAALGQCHGVVDRVGDVGEQLGHFLGRLQVLLGAVVARTARVVEYAPGGDAHAGLVRVEAVAVEEAHIVAGHHRQAAHAGRVQGEAVEGFLAVAIGAGQLQVQAVAEAALPVGQMLLGQIMAALGKQAPGQALAPGQCEQPCVRVQQPFRADRHAAFRPLAFHPCTGQQARQGEIAVVVAAQHGQPPRRHVVGRGDHQVGAGNGLDAHLFGAVDQLDQREQVVQVGDGDGRHPHLDRAAEQVGALGLGRVCVIGLLGHADRRIRHREFGMQVQMDETGRRHAGPALRRVRLERGGRRDKA